MRGLKSTIALVAVLGGLFAYIYFVTWRQPASGSETKQEKVFASLEGDKIDQLTVKAESGETTLKKEKDGWKIVAPLTAPAQETEVSGITSALAQTEVTRVIDDNPQSLNDYGLAMPRMEIAFKTPGDKDYRTLLIGQKSPTGAGLFAKRADQKRVLLIPAYQEQALNKSTFDLRDKTVLKFDRDKVDHIAVNVEGKPLELAKTGSDWNLTKPVQAAADFGAVEGLVGRIQGAQMKSIVSENGSPQELRKYGLERPSDSVTLGLGSAKAELVIGGKAPDGSLYARDVSKPAIMTIDSSLADELKKGAADYRRKDLFAFRAYDATRIEINRGGQTIAFDKVKGSGANAEDKWHRSSPSPADVDKEKMSVFLAKLESLRATSFADPGTKTGLDSPVLTVDAKFDDGKKEERVVFGKSGDAVFAKRADDPTAAKVSETEFADVNKALDDVSK